MRRFLISLLCIIGASHPIMSSETAAFDRPQTVTKSRARWKPKSEQTHKLFVSKINGVKCLIGVYPDVRTITCLTGRDRGVQWVVKKIHGSKVKPQDSTSSVKKMHNKMAHKYKWGTIITSKSKQEIRKG